MEMLVFPTRKLEIEYWHAKFFSFIENFGYGYQHDELETLLLGKVTVRSDKKLPTENSERWVERSLNLKRKNMQNGPLLRAITGVGTR